MIPNGSSWATATGLGKLAVAAPAISTRGVGLLDVFIRSTDDHLYQKSYANNTWGSWVDLGPYFD